MFNYENACKKLTQKKKYLLSGFLSGYLPVKNHE